MIKGIGLQVDSEKNSPIHNVNRLDGQKCYQIAQYTKPLVLWHPRLLRLRDAKVDFYFGAEGCQGR